jgi:hypothetical protein
MRNAFVSVVAAVAFASAGGCRAGMRPLPTTGAMNRTIVETARPAAPIDATTIHRKLLFGYQGWFGCPGDGSPLGAGGTGSVAARPRMRRRCASTCGRPVLAIWGLGFTDRSPTPAQAAELIDFFKNHPDPRYRVTLLGGVPSRWRTLTRDSRSDAAWARIYRSFDIISPWTVGRFRDALGIGQFYAEEVAKDLAETRRLGIESMPVLYPGFSWHNMNRAAQFNPMPRETQRRLRR